MDQSFHEFFGDTLSSYSRAQAISDGVLVDLAVFEFRGAPILEQLRFSYPVAMTCTAFGENTSPARAWLFCWLT